MLKAMVMLLTVSLLSCLAKKNEDPIITPSKFGDKFKNLHQTIVIRNPGVYDYSGVMHLWKGEGSCSVFGAKYPVMEIHADNVTIRNFGFKEAKVGIVVADKENGTRSNVVLENIEGRSCLTTLEMPTRSQNITLKDSILVVEP